MKPSVQNLFRTAQHAHETLYKQIEELKAELNVCRNMHELADYTFAIDKAHDLIEDSKAQLWKLKEEAVKFTCLCWIGSQINHPAGEHNIKTDYVTATPDIKKSPNIPKKGTPEWRQLLDYLNIPDFGLNEKGEPLEIAKIHWPALVEYLSNLEKEGRPVPPGIDVSKLTPVFKLALRKKRNVLDKPQE